MRTFLLLKCLLAIGVICFIAYSIQSCKKSGQNNNNNQNNNNGYPPQILDMEASGCLLVGNTIQFSYYLDGGTVSNSLWNFGDSTTSTDVFPSHVYSHPGNYTVTLSVNNNTPQQGGVSITIRVISAFEQSHYTSQMGGVRLWSGNDDIQLPENIVDTSLSIQVLDSGTIVFMADTMHLINIDTVNNKVLTYSDCYWANLSYYYSKDSIIYIYNEPEGKDALYINLHSP